MGRRKSDPAGGRYGANSYDHDALGSGAAAEGIGGAPAGEVNIKACSICTRSESEQGVKDNICR